jgi:cytochrome c-type biogenesis protein CcmH/NrfG
MAKAVTLAGLQSDILKRGYSLDEIEHLYALGRFYLENGNLRAAAVMFEGLIAVVPDFTPASLGQATALLFEQDYPLAMAAARRALAADPQSTEAMLILVVCMLAQGDYNSAGMFLGEVKEAIDSGSVPSNSLIRLFRILMARYENRPK